MTVEVHDVISVGLMGPPWS